MLLFYHKSLSFYSAFLLLLETVSVPERQKEDEFLRKITDAMKKIEEKIKESIGKRWLFEWPFYVIVNVLSYYSWCVIECKRRCHIE